MGKEKSVLDCWPSHSLGRRYCLQSWACFLRRVALTLHTLLPLLCCSGHIHCEAAGCSSGCSGNGFSFPQDLLKMLYTYLPIFLDNQGLLVLWICSVLHSGERAALEAAPQLQRRVCDMRNCLQDGQWWSGHWEGGGSGIKPYEWSLLSCVALDE